MRTRATIFATTAALLLAGGVAPAHADETPSGVAQFLGDVESVAPGALEEAALGAGDARDSEVVINDDAPTAELTVGETAVTLPVGEGAIADTLPTGDVVLIGQETTFAALEKIDGSVQVVFTVPNASSPSEYSFGVEPVPGARFEFLGDGSVFYVGSDGRLIIGAAPPWAKDATGADVPTHFEVREGALVQVVDHSAPGIVYPIVADPWLGADLFDKITKTTANGLPKYNLWKSAWGHTVHAPGLAGILIMLDAGWNEAKSKQPGLTAKATLRQQYECHVYGGFYNVVTGEWNLEQHRPTRTDSWVVGLPVHRCNWDTANGF